MHDALLSDPLLRSTPHVIAPSPITHGCMNFTQTAVAYDLCLVEMVAVLPCYWVYAQVGLGLAKRTGVVENHLYGTRMTAYADPAFQEATAMAIELPDEMTEAADDATRTVILDTFAGITRCEELFWEHSHCLEAWTL